MASPRPVALDHNFPEPILRSVAEWLEELDFHWVKHLPDGDLNELEEHDLIYELARRNFPVMVTNNHKMLDDRRVLVAIEQTRLTVVAIEKAGDDPIFATGVLLRDLVNVVKQDPPKGIYYRIRPSRVRASRARRRLEELIGDTSEVEEVLGELGRPWSERRPYAEGDTRRIR